MYERAIGLRRRLEQLIREVELIFGECVLPGLLRGDLALEELACRVRR